MTCSRPAIMPIYDATPDNPNPRLGWVYVLSSPDHTYLKIGATRKHPIDRAKEVSAGTGVPRPYELAYYKSFEDAFAAEALIHEALADYRVNESREFFSATLDEVIAAMDEVGGSAGLTGGAGRRAASRPVDTSMAELFASFPDDGSPRSLTPEEQVKCRALERTLSHHGLHSN